MQTGAGTRGQPSIDAAPAILQPIAGFRCLHSGRRSTARLVVRIVLFCLLTHALAACGSAAPLPQATSPARTPEATTLVLPDFSGEAEAATRALVFAEARAAAESDMATLAALWAEDATLIETRNTPALDDDYRWIGRDAILDRYLVAVFPSPPPPPAAPPTAPVQVDGDRATLVNGVDAWTFVHRDGRWWIDGLVIGEK